MKKKAINILEKELKDWKQCYKHEQQYFKSDIKCKLAKQSFRICKKTIKDLEEAIEILIRNYW
jgi:hypothetical protein